MDNQKKSAGRPKATPTKVLSNRLPKDLVEEFEEIIEENDLSGKKVVQRLIKDWIEQVKSKNMN